MTDAELLRLADDEFKVANDSSGSDAAIIKGRRPNKADPFNPREVAMKLHQLDDLMGQSMRIGERLSFA